MTSRDLQYQLMLAAFRLSGTDFNGQFPCIDWSDEMVMRQLRARFDSIIDRACPNTDEVPADKRKVRRRKDGDNG